MNQYYIRDPSSNSGVKTAVVAGALVALVAANVYLYIQVDRLHTDMAKMHESLMTEITNVRETSSVTTASQKKHLETLKDELSEARRQAAQAAGQAKAEAVKRAEIAGSQNRDTNRPSRPSRRRQPSAR